MRYLDLSQPVTKAFLLAMAARCKCKAFVVGGWQGKQLTGKPMFSRLTTPVQIGHISTTETHTRELCIGPATLERRDHAQGCVVREWLAGTNRVHNINGRDYQVPRPDCDCGWLEFQGLSH